MTSTTVTATQPFATKAPELARTRNLDQWICWWSIPVFYNIFGIVFVYLTRLMPPPSPGLTTEGIVAFIQSNSAHLQLGIVVLSLSLGLASLSSGIIVVQMRRMKGVSPALAYTYLAALAVAALPGCLFCALLFDVAAFRPDRDPRIIVLLYDMGLLSFVGSLGCFIVQYTVFAIAIFLDEREIFPKWLGYMSIWGVVTELLAIPIWIFRSGPYAWNGLISFYLGTLIFVVWEFCLVVCLYKAIKAQPIDEVLA
jgi:hypothetical protein